MKNNSKATIKLKSSTVLWRKTSLIKIKYSYRENIEEVAKYRKIVAEVTTNESCYYQESCDDRLFFLVASFTAFRFSLYHRPEG